MATRPGEVRFPCTLHYKGQNHRLAGSTPTVAPPRRRTHEFVATSAKFSMNDNKKTPEPAIERRREARRQSDKRAGPSVDMHAPGEPGDLPYAVGCPAFTRELRQVQWPSTKNFKPDVPEKYDGRLHPSEFLSIYTIAV